MVASKRYSHSANVLDISHAMKQQAYAQLVGGSGSSRSGSMVFGEDGDSADTQCMSNAPDRPYFTPMPYLEMTSPTSPTLPSPASSVSQRQSRELNRQSFQSYHYHQRQRRRSSLLLGPGYSPQRPQSRVAKHDSSAVSAAQKRMSLGSYQHAALGRHFGKDMKAMHGLSDEYMDDTGGYAKPMWSEEQLRRARRFSSSHARVISCPTLNITRIMRSISVSSDNISVNSSNSGHSLAKQARREFVASPGLLASFPTMLKGAPGNARSSFSKRSSIVSGGYNAGDQDDFQARQQHRMSQLQALSIVVPSSLNTLPEDTAETRMPPQVGVDGLRRRTSIRLRHAGTPDININSGEPVALLSPSLTEEGYPETGDAQGRPTVLMGAQYNSAQDGPLPRSRSGGSSVASSARSSACWSTISAESPHKRYSYSSAAIAEALRNLQSVSRHSDINFRDFSLRTRLDGGGSISSNSSKDDDEKMTITLKGPPRHNGDDTGTDAGSGAGSNSQNQHNGWAEEAPANTNSQSSNETTGFPKLEAFMEPWSQRPSTDDGEVAVPALYLDSTTSLWDQYVSELQSSEFDPNIHLKRKRVYQFLRVPWNVEKLLWFGIAICFDALIYVFSILPAKFVHAAFTLAMAVLSELPAIVESACESALVQVALCTLPARWRERLVSIGRRMQQWVARLSGCAAVDSSRLAATGGSMMRWLSPAQLFDFYRGLLLIITCVVLCRIDAAQMYHGIRAQSSLKLYFIFSALDIFDRLLSSFGYDILDALQSTVTDPRSQRWKSGAGYFALAQLYMLVHTLVLFYQVITLNVAVNAYSDQLLSLLISNQFVEIKSNVFKKWEKEMLFQVACADIVERFQEIVFLFIIILRNLAELSGTGISPLFASSSPTATTPGNAGAVLPTAQPPVSFDSATPSAFGPLVPAWVSIPLVNRIVTPVLMVLGTELLIDWIKHAFITKLNWIRPEIYSHYIDILSRDLACSKPGARVRGVPLLPRNGVDSAASSADEKIGRSSADNYESQDNSISEYTRPTRSALTRSRSSSILVHAALKLYAWVQGNLLSETIDNKDKDNDGNSAGSQSGERCASDVEGRSSLSAHANSFSRQCEHQRVQSVTRPQLFVEQSSRVARRLGLSPMPIACMIMLMLMQVAHIMMQSSRLQHNSAPTQSATATADMSNVFWLVGCLTAVPLLGIAIRVVLSTCSLIASVLTVDVFSKVGYAILHPSTAVTWFSTLVTSLLDVFRPSAQHDYALKPTMSAGWVALDVLGWIATVLIVYALVVWIKLAFGNRLMHFAWSRFREFERRTAECKGTDQDTANLKQYDDLTKKSDHDSFTEVGKLIGREKSEKEWEKQRPKWTLDNIERYSLFKSRIP
ncbi:eukaryotic membrane protein family-domain-containing protein [Kickxella alabastrina]|uniref:eukaryotic membrane protein family-domain-containing protein n=1 Tax=Kickxella alabastrina TaxID=61397 RepID=UPI00222082C6|nr:eukaryotic membrane protein family-domain-containing protein [Kickxella alabastrina]KAI7834952.1 eukaryotic membrane protein family-domain-containing protein [Kickxella alabastrina]